MLLGRETELHKNGCTKVWFLTLEKRVEFWLENFTHNIRLGSESTQWIFRECLGAFIWKNIMFSLDPTQNVFFQRFIFFRKIWSNYLIYSGLIGVAKKKFLKYHGFHHPKKNLTTQRMVFKFPRKKCHDFEISCYTFIGKCVRNPHCQNPLKNMDKKSKTW